MAHGDVAVLTANGEGYLMPADEGASLPSAAAHVPPAEALPVLLVPGLLTSARLYAEQITPLWRFGPVTVTDNTQAGTMSEIAGSILAAAPPRFALAGLSMGGYIALEIVRQAAGRVVQLALLDTTSRPDTPAQSERRRSQIAKTQAGGFSEIPGEQWPLLVSPANLGNQTLFEIVQVMARETGPEAFARQQQALMTKSDMRPHLAAVGCPTLVLVGEDDRLTPPELAAETADGIPGARLVSIPGSGHLSTLEQPELVTRALHEWLSQP